MIILPVAVESVIQSTRRVFFKRGVLVNVPVFEFGSQEYDFFFFCFFFRVVFGIS